VVKGVMIYIRSRTGDMASLVIQSDWSSISAAGALSFWDWQRFFVFLALAITGAGLVARDRRENGLALYFSRPLGLTDYLVGKALVVVGAYLMVTLLPALVLCLFSYLIDPAAAGLEMLLWTPARLTIFGVLSGAGLALIMLALSSMATRTVLVVVWWTVIAIGGDIVGHMGQGLGAPDLQFMNFLKHWQNAGSLVLASGPRLPVSPWASLALLTVVVAVAVAVLRRRIRPVEVVT
jgi:ABC-type transport system involved in multi-copper enzyme maturation permease subunit